jgi:hypothetical protein
MELDDLHFSGLVPRSSEGTLERLRALLEEAALSSHGAIAEFATGFLAGLSEGKLSYSHEDTK